MSMLEKAIEAECLTHWTISRSGNGKDWNDLLVNDGDSGLKAEFLKNLKKV
jgi:hypothetical protein